MVFNYNFTKYVWQKVLIYVYNKRFTYCDCPYKTVAFVRHSCKNPYVRTLQFCQKYRHLYEEYQQILHRSDPILNYDQHLKRMVMLDLARLYDQPVHQSDYL